MKSKGVPSLFKNNNEAEVNNKEILKPNGYDYNYFIYIEQESLSMEIINQKLLDYYSSKSKEVKFKFFNANHLVLTLDKTYNFHFSFERGKDVKLEASELGLSPDNIKSRIEFWGDTDADGIYLNEHLFLLEQLESENLILYNIKQGYFL